MTACRDAVQPAPDDDRDEFVGRLYKQYYRPVSWFFRKRGVPSDACSDLAQETFLRVHRGIDGFRRDAKITTWLFKIAANVWLNTVRDSKAAKRAGRHVPLDEAVGDHVGRSEDPRGTPRSVLQHLLDQERVERVRGALAELPPQMRRCLLLYADQRLTYREIAVVMNVAEGTVKSQIHESRERLRLRLGETLELREGQ